MCWPASGGNDLHSSCAVPSGHDRPSASRGDAKLAAIDYNTDCCSSGLDGRCGNLPRPSQLGKCPPICLSSKSSTKDRLGTFQDPYRSLAILSKSSVLGQGRQAATQHTQHRKQGWLCMQQERRQELKTKTFHFMVQQTGTNVTAERKKSAQLRLSVHVKPAGVHTVNFTKQRRIFLNCVNFEQYSRMSCLLRHYGGGGTECKP